MRLRLLPTIASFAVALLLLVLNLGWGTHQAAAFSCSKTDGGSTVEMCCSQTGKACSQVFGEGWVGTCGDPVGTGWCGEAVVPGASCGPDGNQACTPHSGSASVQCAQPLRDHFTSNVSKILKVSGVTDTASNPLDNVNVTVWFNEAQMNQLRRFGDKIGDPAWGPKDGKGGLAGYTVYWTSKDNLNRSGGRYSKDYELGFATGAKIVGKEQRGYDFGNVLQFLSIADKPELLNIRIRVQARSFKATSGYFCVNPTTGQCQQHTDPSGSRGFLLQASCQAECQRPCPPGATDADCVPRPGINPPLHYVLSCASNDQACKDNRPDDWRKGTQSTWRVMTTIFDQVVPFNRYECLAEPIENVGNSVFTMRCVENQCNANAIPESNFKFELANIVQPLATLPGTRVNFRVSWGWEPTEYSWTEAEKATIRGFMGTPQYEGWYDGDRVICDRWNSLSTNPQPILTCPGQQNMNYRMTYVVSSVGDEHLLARHVILSGGTPFQIPENNTRPAQEKITLHRLSEHLRERGWLDRKVPLSASISVAIPVEGGESYPVFYENAGTQFTSLKPEDLCSDCAAETPQCSNPVFVTGRHVFEQDSSGNFAPITLHWTHEDSQDNATEAFRIAVGGLTGSSAVPNVPRVYGKTMYTTTLNSTQVKHVFSHMQANGLGTLPVTITTVGAAVTQCGNTSVLVTQTTYGCTANGQCVAKTGGKYTTSNCNNECRETEEYGYACANPVTGQCELRLGGEHKSLQSCQATCNNTSDPGGYACANPATNQCEWRLGGGGFENLGDCQTRCQDADDPDPEAETAANVTIEFRYTSGNQCSAVAGAPSLSGTHNLPVTDKTINLGQTKSYNISMNDLPLTATVAYNNPDFLCNNACTTTGMSGSCSHTKALTSTAYVVSVQDISSMLNHWWQSVGGLTYGNTVNSAVPKEDALQLLPGYDGSTDYDQFVTRSPSWVRDYRGGVLLGNSIVLNPPNPNGIPSFWRSERPNPSSTDYAPSLTTDFVSGALPQLNNSMYEYFKDLLERRVEPNHTATNATWTVFPAMSSAEDSEGSYKYAHITGNLTISPASTTLTVPSGEKIIVLVDGAVTIRAINLTPTTDNRYKPIAVEEGGLFLLVAKGNITIESNVGEEMNLNQVPTLAQSSTQTQGKTTLDGLYLSDQNIIIAGNGDNTAADRRFIGAGSFVGKSGVSMSRSFSKSGMTATQRLNGRYLYGYTPTDIFYHRPDMVLALPNILKSSVMQYQEIL